jgi:hypothetical protein
MSAKSAIFKTENPIEVSEQVSYYILTPIRSCQLREINFCFLPRIYTNRTRIEEI